MKNVSGVSWLKSPVVILKAEKKRKIEWIPRNYESRLAVMAHTHLVISWTIWSNRGQVADLVCPLLHSSLGSWFSPGRPAEGSECWKLRDQLCVLSVWRRQMLVSGLIVRWSELMSQNKIIISIQILQCGIWLVLLHSDSKLTEYVILAEFGKISERIVVTTFHGKW